MSIISLLAMAGLVDSIYLWRKRHTPGPLVCPLKQDCKALYQMPQARFLGVHWDIWGMLYFAALIVLSLLKATALIHVLAVVGLIVSIYLFYVQAKVRNFCTWCLLSELVVLVIFGLTVLTY